MNYEVLHIDQLANICGYFSSDTIANNGYGCEHPGCGDSDLMVKKNSEYEHAVNRFDIEHHVIARRILVRKTSNRRKVKKAIKKAILITHNNIELGKLGLKQQGKCYDFSCPLCFTAENYCEENGLGYEYAVTTSLAPPASGTATPDTFYVATGLTPNTEYYVHVRTHCGSTPFPPVVHNFSPWITDSFTTPATCLPPDTPSVFNITTYSAQMSWNLYPGIGG